MIYIIGALLLIFIIYMWIPNYYAREQSLNVYKKINAKETDKKIVLTFDDGPDHRYTDKLLDILKKYNVKATFFLVVNNIEKNKQIVQRMINEGHDIAMHSLKHKSAWLSLPWETKNEFERCLEVFKELGIDIKFFRPPWGTFNAVSLKYALKKGLKVVLWSVQANDWRKNNSPQLIEEMLLNRTKANDIIVLHDSGGAKEAPYNTLKALETTIPKLITRGFQFVTLKQEIGDVEYGDVKKHI